MRRMQDKKLLVISSDASDMAFVEAARELGAGVICCDRYADWDISPAKKMADEAWDIDYKETEIIARKCREAGVDGVIAGYGEDRVLAACLISEAIGSPFYATCQQIEITRDKEAFKKLCRQYGIAVPQDFGSSLPLTQVERAAIQYPVIVKPADSGGRKGISICDREDQLEAALQLAERHSQKGSIVIESYLEGIELSAIYTLADGKISLSCLNDKYIAQGGGSRSKLCDLVVTPSAYLSRYRREVDPKIKALLEGIGARNGVASFQFIANPQGIWAFEMGYRVNGNDDFKVIRHFNGLDFMKMLVTYSLTGSMGDDLARDNPAFDAYAATLVLHLKRGTLGRVDYGSLLGQAGIEDICLRKKPGSVVLGSGTNEQKAMMVKMTAADRDSLIEQIVRVQKAVVMEDQAGANMLMPPFDTGRLKGKS